MSRTLLTSSMIAALAAGTAYADAPRVAVDIAPVHSLVARVMEGVGTPDLIVQSGASPHEYSLRPSEAGSLEVAELVFWIGEDLTPWMEDAIETLASGAKVTALLELQETQVLAFREGALFEAHDHGHEDEKDHDHHNDHAEKDEHHDHNQDHDGHADDHHDHEGHDHGEHDPHAWLSPNNAKAWLNVIAARLSVADPENAGAYYANAAAGQSEIDAMSGEIARVLDPVRGNRFIVFHDAYQYFETAFELPAAGAISLSDASDPSPARIGEIQARVRDQNIGCVLSEPQFNPAMVATVMDGTEAATAVLDPLGSVLETGSDLYPSLMRNLAQAMADCLK